MTIDNLKERIEKHFELFEKTSITLENSILKTPVEETLVREKREIIEENKDKKALIRIKDLPEKYILGKLEPKNEISFGLKAIEHGVEYNYCEIIRYDNLSELMLCNINFNHINKNNNKI